MKRGFDILITEYKERYDKFINHEFSKEELIELGLEYNGPLDYLVAETFKSNVLELLFDLIKIKEEIFYEEKEIRAIVIKESKDMSIRVRGAEVVPYFKQKLSKDSLGFDDMPHLWLTITDVLAGPSVSDLSIKALEDTMPREEGTFGEIRINKFLCSYRS